MYATVCTSDFCVLLLSSFRLCGGQDEAIRHLGGPLVASPTILRQALIAPWSSVRILLSSFAMVPALWRIMASVMVILACLLILGIPVIAA